MKKYLFLIPILTLTACGGGSSGEHGASLTPAEHLFGAGIGTGQIPSHLVPREDGAGFEILSFGAWGNIYDIKETSNNITYQYFYPHESFYVRSGSKVYDFMGQQNQLLNQWTYLKDGSVSNATFTGPAIMYKGTGNYASGFLADNSDYGTMKLKFGYDIDTPPTLEFVMSNPENNLTVENFNGTPRFSEDRNDVYIWHVQKDNPDGPIDAIYRGYGHKN